MEELTSFPRIPEHHLDHSLLEIVITEIQAMFRPRPIMLKILLIMLLSIAQKSSLLCSKICFQNQDYAREVTVVLE